MKCDETSRRQLVLEPTQPWRQMPGITGATLGSNRKSHSPCFQKTESVRELIFATILKMVCSCSHVRVFWVLSSLFTLDVGLNQNQLLGSEKL